MDVDFAILADSAQLVNEKVFLLGGGWTAIWAREIPTVHRGAFALGIRVSWDETNERHTLAVEVRDIDGELVQEIAKGEFEAGRPPGIAQGADQLINIAANVDFKLEATGEYVVVVEIDGNLEKRIPFQVGRI